MKTSEAIVAYQILDGLKLKGMAFPAKMAIIENLRKLKEVTDNYTAGMELSKKKFFGDEAGGFEAFSAKVEQHNAALRNGEQGVMTPEEVAQLESFNKEMNGWMEAEHRKELDLQLEKIEAAEFEKLDTANEDQLEAGKLTFLYNMIVNS